MMRIGEKIKDRCNSCGASVNHEVINIQRRRDSELINNEFEISWGDDYTILKCYGCDSVRIKHEDWFSEDTGHDGAPHIRVRYYPPTIFRKEPEWFRDLDEEWHITKLCREVYAALQNSCPSLAAMGLRAVLEAIMIDKVGDQGTFNKNLKSFEENGYISKIQMGILKNALELGHASIHRGFVPDNEQVIFALDLTETIVHHLYLLNDQANNAVSNIPQRDIKNA